MAGVGEGGGSPTRLSTETELQKMLTDEKMRSEQHRTNYTTLKTQHTRLQDEYVALQEELKATIEESKLVQEKYRQLLEQARREVTAKHKECEELRLQVMSEQRLEVLKLQLQEEVEDPFRAKLHAAEAEIEELRGELNKLRYEHSFLQQEYQHERTQHQQVTDEMKLRYESELSNVRAERESVLTRTQAEGGHDQQRVRTLQRENAQLHLKVKGLLTELQEIRAQSEYTGIQSDSVNRLQTKQLAEHAANIKALETEKGSLRMQVDNLTRELATTADQQTQMTAKVHELEKENLVLKNRADEVMHKSKVDMTNVKMGMLKERGQLERERDQLRNSIEELTAQLELSQHAVEQQAGLAAEKERDAVKRVQAAREEEWARLNQVETDKMELETRLQELERRRIDEETQRQQEKERTEETVRAAQEARDAAEKEALVFRTKLSNQEALQEQVERERSENADLKVRIHRVETEFNSYVSSERELIEKVTSLKAENDALQEEMRRHRSDAARSRDAVEHQVAEQRALWLEEKTNMQLRVDELERELEKLHQKVVAMIGSYKKKKNKYNQLISKLKDRNTLLSAKVEELNIEKDYLKKCVPPDQYNQLKKRWDELLRRHRDFRSVLLGGELREVKIGDLSFSSVNHPGAPPADLTPANLTLNLNDTLGFSAVNVQNEKDLEYIKERLDILDGAQRQQLHELKTISRVISPIPTRDGAGDEQLQSSPIPTRDTEEEVGPPGGDESGGDVCPRTRDSDDDSLKMTESEKSDS